MIKIGGGTVKLKKKLDRLTEPERRLVLAFIRGMETANSKEPVTGPAYIPETAAANVRKAPKQKDDEEETE